MKLRIKDDSIRLRLSEIDLNELREHHEIMASCRVGQNQVLNYGIKISSVNESIEAEFLESNLTITLGTNQAQNWMETDQVGFDTRIDNESTESLYILIEKDWQCLKPRPNEDESSLFPNPNALI